MSESQSTTHKNGDTSFSMFLSFIPKNRIPAMLSNPNDTLIETHRYMDAVVLFSDISGFTPMSEALSRFGKEGTEEMSNTLNQYLSAMFALIDNHQGIPQKIAGDALTVFFLKPDDQSWEDCITNAIHCALNMQHLMDNYKAIQTKAGTFTLSMKVGMSKGQVFSTILGSYELGLEHIITGEPIDEAAHAEGCAQPGEIWIDSLVHDAIKEVVRSVEDKNGFYRITRIFKELADSTILPEAALPDKSSDFDILHERVKLFVPPSIAERIQLGFRGFLAENRKVTILFVSFDGLDFHHESFATELSLYYRTMQEVIHRFQGHLYEYESGDKGNKIIVVFGAPIATENCEELALICALELQRKAKQFKWLTNQKIGITSGNTYTGVIGDHQLRRYAIIGDTVNLSARLMSKAPQNTIYIDVNTQKVTADRFQIETLEKIKVKGKKQPVPVFQLEGMRDPSPQTKGTIFGEHVLIGKEQAFDRLVELTKQAKAFQCQIVSIEANSGVGKGSFVRKWEQEAIQMGFEGAIGTCYIYSKPIPYYPWQQILSRMFQIDQENLTQEEKIDRIETTLKKVSSTSANLSPLVGQMMGIDVPENEWTQHLDIPVRKSSLSEIIIEYLIQYSKQKPFYIIIEDLHFCDSVSMDLLASILVRVKNSSIIIVFSNQPWEDKPPTFIQQVQKNLSLHTVELSELNLPDCKRYLEKKYHFDSIPESFVTFIHKTTNGNAFFLEEVINMLIESGNITKDSGGKGYQVVGDTQSFQAPDSIQSMITTRIDQLDETNKLICKVASVIGETYKQDILQNVLPFKINKADLEKRLQTMIQSGIIGRETKENTYRFRNNMVQSVVYETLLSGQRVSLHSKTANFMESSHKRNLETVYNVLAYHYSRSENDSKKIYYLSEAAKRAQNIYANQEAIEYYNQLIPIIEKQMENMGDPNTKKWEKICKQTMDAHLSLADSYRFTGAMDRSKKHLDRAQELMLLLMDEKRRYQVLRSMGEWHEFSDQLKVALQYYHRAYLCIKKMKRPKDQSLALGSLGNVYRSLGSYDQAMECYLKAADLAQSIGDEALQGRWLGNVGTVKMNQGAYESALEYYKRSQEISVRVQDKSREAAWLNLMGEVYISTGEYQKALECCNQSLAITREIGFRRSEMYTLSTIGGAYGFLGQYAEALASYQHSTEIASQIGAASHEVTTLGKIGEILRWKEEFDQALEYYHAAKEMAEKIGDKYNAALWERGIGIIEYTRIPPQIKQARHHLKNAYQQAKQIGHQRLETETMIHLGFSVAKDGELEEGAGLIEKGIEMAKNMDHPGLRIWGTRILGMVLLDLGEKESGLELIRKALTENEQLGLLKDLAECHLLIGQALKDRTHLEEAKRIFTKIHLDARVNLVNSVLNSIGM